MRLCAQSLFAGLAIAVVLTGAPAFADDTSAAPQVGPGDLAKPDAEAPQTKPDEPPPQTPAEARADLYARLAVTLLLRAYAESGSDTADLLLRRARQAIGAEEYPDALKILDATIALQPDWAEGWNARATARYLDDDYDGSMADIAQTLKREPRHLGALMGMAAILEARGKTEDALKVYEQALKIAPHWRNAQEAADRLKAALAGEEL
ncbi:tetratricopeptide repeat protein [Roseiarcus sp.]|uniref:tetratricopeptide repeat protein n=1 Tax=Roseiarcus sp. TaxID=1969460 RepID=UPI003D12F8CE